MRVCSCVPFSFVWECVSYAFIPQVMGNAVAGEVPVEYSTEHLSVALARTTTDQLEAQGTDAGVGIDFPVGGVGLGSATVDVQVVGWAADPYSWAADTSGGLASVATIQVGAGAAWVRDGAYVLRGVVVAVWACCWLHSHCGRAGGSLTRANVRARAGW
jgi:hypothetical protein